MSVVVGATALSAVVFSYIRAYRYHKHSKQLRNHYESSYEKAIDEYEKFMKMGD